MATGIKGVKEIFDKAEEAIIGDDGRIKNRRKELPEQDAIETLIARIPFWDK